MIGARLGKWVLDRELGRGGMGRVFQAHEEPGGRPAAVKVLGADLAQEPGFLARFQREIEILGQLNHPKIVCLYDSGSQDGHFYYAMEYVEGADFEQLLQQQGRLSYKDVLDAALQVCPALKHAHDRGIIHRDIKPPNLLRGPEGVVKLTDFGIAKVFASRHLTSTGGVVGTAEYLSPEQAAGKTATRRSDLYCLGAVMYTLLTGRPPFEGKSSADILHKHLYGQFVRPVKLLPQLPHEVDEIVCQLLEKDPAKRPADALVLQRQLERVCRRLERRSRNTILEDPAEATLAENEVGEAESSNPGTATLVSRLVKQELEEQNTGGPVRRLFNRPLVLIVLFLLCVSVIVWRLWPRPVPSADALYEQGAKLMSSDDAADWQIAWSDYLEPLQRLYPANPHQEEVEAFRRQIDDYAELRRALVALRQSTPMTEAQRFYEKGLRQSRQGDADSARQTWQDVVQAFSAVPTEERWVHLSQLALHALDRKLPASDHRAEAIREALRAAREHDGGKIGPSVQALEELYRDDRVGKSILEQQLQHR
jgi:serine/threonine-protein kinase